MAELNQTPAQPDPAPHSGPRERKLPELPHRDWDNLTLDWSQYEGQWKRSADGTHWELRFVYYAVHLHSRHHQYMNLFVPAPYLKEDGSVNEDGVCGGYTAKTAPIVLYNACHGWMSSVPGEANMDYLNAGFVHIFVGARSRELGDAGKAPAPCVDQKAAVRMLRLHGDKIPGDKERIISCGTSGGGQMSSVLGASGNMPTYLPYLYEMGAAGVERTGDGALVSTIRDDIFASQCFCPIADIENADMAYAWQRYDDPGISFSGFNVVGEQVLSPFKLALQRDLAQEYCAYLNSLGLTGEDGEPLSFDRTSDGLYAPRSGSYYDRMLEEISGALNKWISACVQPDGSVYYKTFHFVRGEEEFRYPSLEAYLATKGDLSQWLEERDGGYTVTDFAAFIRNTGLPRGKDCPGFDTFHCTAENNAFGLPGERAVHFSASVGRVLEANRERYRELDGYDECDVDTYIAQSRREDLTRQIYLMNATHILLNAAVGREETTPARYWRTRNGTADEHTAFTVAFNLCMAARKAGCDADYSLIWNAGHGEVDGDGTGTFVQWVKEICK